MNIFKETVFTDFLSENDIHDRDRIRELLLNNKFKLIRPRLNGNDYHNYVDEDGYLRFTNPDMNVQRGELSRGILRSDGALLGNTVTFGNLMILKTEINKKEILSDLADIESQRKKLNEKQKELEEQLDYLMQESKEILKLDEYKVYRKAKLTKSLIDTKINNGGEVIFS